MKRGRIATWATLMESLEARHFLSAVPGFVAVGDATSGVVSLLDVGRNETLSIPATVLGNGEHGLVPYGAGFRRGVAVGVGDVNGDGRPDIVTAPASGGVPLVEVFDAVTGRLERNFYAYSPGFWGGVRVAVGDVNGDGKADIVTGTGAGGVPLVNVFDGATGALVRSFYAYDVRFRGGVNVATGDVNGDGKADVITGTGFGGVPLVNVFDGGTGRLARSFFGFNASFTGGVTVVSADFDGDGKADIVVGTGRSSQPDIREFSGATGAVVAESGGYGNTGGITFAAIDDDGDGKADLVVGHGAMIALHGGPILKGTTLARIGGWGNITGFEEVPNVNGAYLAGWEGA